MTSTAAPQLDTDALRASIREEYAAVAGDPERGFHFRTGRRLADLLGYTDELLAGIPKEAIASMAGTGNPFALGPLAEGERIVDCGSGSASTACSPPGWWDRADRSSGST